MELNINQAYSQFYKGTKTIKCYTSNEELKKDTLVEYEFNTTDEEGNKTADKMSIEETKQVINEISSQYGSNVIVKFSGDALADLAEKVSSGKISIDKTTSADPEKQAEFESAIVYLDRSAGWLPEYSGIYSADKAIAAALENCTQEEKAFVYDTIRQNFLIANSSSMTEEERLANISLGMKKAEYAASSFISEDDREAFLNAMESVAKLAASGKADADGNMDYGIGKGNYLGSGSGLIYTNDPIDIMKRTDSEAYAEYQSIVNDTSIDGDEKIRKMASYMMHWYINAVEENPNLVSQYEKGVSDYISETVDTQELSNAFENINTGSKASFLESLKAFQLLNPNFLSSVISRELSSKFWNFQLTV